MYLYALRESYTWYGNVYNAADTYYDTIPATIGCDTAAQLNLTIYHYLPLQLMLMYLMFALEHQ